MDARASFFLLLFLVLARRATAATLSFTNKCPYTVWPGTLTSGGGEQLSSTGFELASGVSSTISDVLETWSGWVWSWIGCATDTSGKFTCAIANCGSGQASCNGAGAIPLASLAEFTLAAVGSGKQDFYDLSLVDGFNLSLSVTPQGSGSGCSTTNCSVVLD